MNRINPYWINCGPAFFQNTRTGRHSFLERGGNLVMRHDYDLSDPWLDCGEWDAVLSKAGSSFIHHDDEAARSRNFVPTSHLFYNHEVAMREKNGQELREFLAKNANIDLRDIEEVLGGEGEEYGSLVSRIKEIVG
eukprot:g19856.t1